MLYRAATRSVLFGASLLGSVACGARTELPGERPGLSVQDAESDEEQPANDVPPDEVNSRPIPRPSTMPTAGPVAPGSGMQSMPDLIVDQPPRPDFGPMMGPGSTAPGVDVTAPVSGPTATPEMTGTMAPVAPTATMPPPEPAEGEERPPCTRTEDAMVYGNDFAQFPFVTEIRMFTDGSSTACIDADEPGRVCMSGRAADANPDYIRWGALLTLSVATEDAEGRLVPFDAQALGIVAIELEMLGVDEGPALRTLLQMSDDPDVELEFNYGANAFVFRSGMETSRDGTHTYPFQGFVQPPWSNLDLDGDGVRETSAMFDSSRLQALQVQVVTSPGIELDYDFCIAGLRWLDDAGAPVTVDGRVR